MTGEHKIGRCSVLVAAWAFATVPRLCALGKVRGFLGLNAYADQTLTTSLASGDDAAVGMVPTPLPGTRLRPAVCMPRG